MATLGYPPLNDPEDFRRLFQVYLAELRPGLLDRVRHYYLSAWRAGGNLASYVALRPLEFITFNPHWPLELEALERDIVTAHAAAAVTAAIGPDDGVRLLPELEPTAAANRKLVAARHAKLAGLVRAWCRKAKVGRPELIGSTRPAAVCPRTRSGRAARLRPTQIRWLAGTL